MYMNANVSNLISKRENNMKFKYKCQLALCWLKIEISLVLFRTSLPWDAFHYWSFSGASVLHKLSQGLIYIWTKDLVKDVPIYVSSKTIMIFGSNDFNSANGLNFLACIQRQIWKKLRHVSFLKHFNRNMKYIVKFETFLDITAWIFRFLFKITVSPYLE